MFRVKLGLFDGERASKKKLKFVFQGQFAVVVLPVGDSVASLAKKLACSKADLEPLSQQEIDIIHQQLLLRHQQVDNRITEVQKQVPQASKVEHKASDCKMSEGYKITFKAPKLDLSNEASVENSIRAMRTANDMKIMSEAQLVYSAIVESDLCDLFACLTTEQKTSVAAFNKYIQTAYGASSLSDYARFEKIRQNENDCNYLSKLCNAYTVLTGRVRSAFNDQDKSTIVSKFVESIDNKAVAAELMKNYSNLTLENVAVSAKNIRKALQCTPTFGVNAVSHSDRGHYSDLDRHRSSSRDRNYRNRSSSRDRNYRNRSSSRDRNYRNRSNSRDRKKVSWSDEICYRCGNQGHYVQECQASWKTVRDFRRKLDKNHQ